ncbi:hypothetical protein QR680_003004 [Steinernema hermaphroditum]|uniref:Bestrophin homolog n=1 Tax=Steinernema hermaphroditum TaxID=289476 RepID=A0AA39H605_9BILA|nr:hypothetical protein QR680_003004 [Steinernema hermaphroditum]
MKTEIFNLYSDFDFYGKFVASYGGIDTTMTFFKMRYFIDHDTLCRMDAADPPQTFDTMRRELASSQIIKQEIGFSEPDKKLIMRVNDFLSIPVCKTCHGRCQELTDVMSSPERLVVFLKGCTELETVALNVRTGFIENGASTEFDKALNVSHARIKLSGIRIKELETFSYAATCFPVPGHTLIVMSDNVSLPNSKSIMLLRLTRSSSEMLLVERDIRTRLRLKEVCHVFERHGELYVAGIRQNGKSSICKIELREIQRAESKLIPGMQRRQRTTVDQEYKTIGHDLLKEEIDGIRVVLGRGIPGEMEQELSMLEDHMQPLVLHDYYSRKQYENDFSELWNRATKLKMQLPRQPSNRKRHLTVHRIIRPPALYDFQTVAHLPPFLYRKDVHSERASSTVPDNPPPCLESSPPNRFTQPSAATSSEMDTYLGEAPNGGISHTNNAERTEESLEESVENFSRDPTDAYPVILFFVERSRPGHEFQIFYNISLICIKLTTCPDFCSVPMTVGYNFDVSSSTHFSLLKILFRWRGSMWKLVVVELCAWIACYFALNVFVRECLNDVQLENFLTVRQELREWLTRIPLIFLLGFFVSVVFNRWVDIFKHIGFIDNLALIVSTVIPGTGNDMRLVRRNIVRYAVLSQALVFRDISLQVRKRFPDIQTIVESGLMTERESELYEAKEMHDSKYWLPIQWAYLLARKLRIEEIIPSDILMNQILEVDTYFPFMTVLEFLFTVGWMKVAEALLNPFGEDDDDFECNYLIDRNLSTGFEIVELYEQPPCDEIDDFWQMTIPRPLDVNVQDPDKKKVTPYHGSIADLNVLRDKSPNPRKSSVFSVTRDLSRRSKVADIERLHRMSSRRRPSISAAGRLSSTNINNEMHPSFISRLDSVFEREERDDNEADASKLV